MAPAKASPYQYSDSFIRAGPRKKRKGRLRQETASTSALLERVANELINSGWMSKCQQMLCDTMKELSFTSTEVLCLGLGSPSCSRDARAQLAFLLSTCDSCDIERRKVLVCDPVFTEADVELLRSLQLNCLADQAQAKYPLLKPTILFMPHCDRNLYENILRENWTKDRLQNMLLIANRFSEYADSIPSHKLMAESPCLSRLAPYLNSKELPTLTSLPTAFNNTSIQLVRQEAWIGLDQDASFWQIPDLPKIDGYVGC